MAEAWQFLRADGKMPLAKEKVTGPGVYTFKGADPSEPDATGLFVCKQPWDALVLNAGPKVCKCDIGVSVDQDAMSEVSSLTVVKVADMTDWFQAKAMERVNEVLTLQGITSGPLKDLAAAKQAFLDGKVTKGTLDTAMANAMALPYIQYGNAIRDGCRADVAGAMWACIWITSYLQDFAAFGAVLETEMRDATK